MNYILRAISYMLFSLGIQTVLAAGLDVIPNPIHYACTHGTFTLSHDAQIAYDRKFQDYAEFLQRKLSASTGFPIRLSKNARKADIFLCQSPELTSPESYSIQVTQKRITVKAADKAGIFYGLQTLLQLFPSEVYSATGHPNVSWTINCVSINDAPERPWRGMMLDVARYFYDKEFVKKYIDIMAMYKLNKLQFHLIDDSGWRVEIKQYPLLTKIGAWSGRQTNRMGGFYTQQDIKELVEYASFRNVEIIPEVEFPAHILSAVVAYPWLSCKGKPLQMPDQHFISRDLLCAGKETTYEFLGNVINELTELFPSEYVNIGGDEAVYDRWKDCPDCQRLMQNEKFTKVSELQSYMTNRVTDILKSKGKKAIGWEEAILRGKLNNPVVAVVWHNVEDSIYATRTGNKAVLTPATNMYFDFPESKTPGEIKAATWLPPVSLEKCYSMPVNDYSESTSTVIGVQGCFWTDQFIHGTILQEINLLNENRSERYAEYLTLPRLLALSEVAWCDQSHRDFTDFRRRINTHFAKLDELDYIYRIPEPEILSCTTDNQGYSTFVLGPSVPGSTIYYTEDGTFPNVCSHVYTGAVKVVDKYKFRAITALSDKRASLPVFIKPDYTQYKQYGQFVGEWTPSLLKKSVGNLVVDCTGKFRGNGQLVITLIYQSGHPDLSIDGLELMKHNESLCNVKSSQVVNSDNRIIQYEISLKEYEAGTPFYLHFRLNGITEESLSRADCKGLIFIRKK